jgi:RimJ/RimL family protein N-acetyltransferase
VAASEGVEETQMRRSRLGAAIGRERMLWSTPETKALRAELIESARLRLEPLATGHAQEMARVLESAALHQFTGGTPDTPEELRARYERLTAGSGEPLVDWLNWVLRVRATGALAGAVQATVRHGRRDPIAEVAWVVGIPWQGAGLAREAVRALVAWLQARGAHTVEAHVHAEHHASAAVALAAGLAQTDETHRGERVWRGPRS